MAKDQRRGNREVKKPKQNKVKPAAAPSAFAALHAKPTLPTAAKKK